MRTFIAFFLTAIAATAAPTNAPSPGTVSVTVSNGTWALIGVGTNFFRSNLNLARIAGIVAPTNSGSAGQVPIWTSDGSQRWGDQTASGDFQPASTNLTNWATIPTNILGSLSGGVPTNGGSYILKTNGAGYYSLTLIEPHNPGSITITNLDLGSITNFTCTNFEGVYYADAQLNWWTNECARVYYDPNSSGSATNQVGTNGSGACTVASIVVVGAGTPEANGVYTNCYVPFQTLYNKVGLIPFTNTWPNTEYFIGSYMDDFTSPYNFTVQRVTNWGAVLGREVLYHGSNVTRTACPIEGFPYPTSTNLVGLPYPNATIGAGAFPTPTVYFHVATNPPAHWTNVLALTGDTLGKVQASGPCGIYFTYTKGGVEKYLRGASLMCSPPICDDGGPCPRPATVITVDRDGVARLVLQVLIGPTWTWIPISEPMPFEDSSYWSPYPPESGCGYP